MKKLMTVLASAATALFAASAVADGVFSESAENFESPIAAGAFDSNNGLNGYWLTGATADEMTVSNHESGVEFPSRPDKWNGAANSNYLQLDVSTPLARGLEEVNGGAFPGVAIGDGIYLDTLVKFTAADDEFQPGSLAEGDKIAISYVEHEDDVTTELINEAYTNFVICAGAHVGGQFVQTNYFATVPAGFNKDDWHRLTVRSIEDVGDGQVGFVIYLDGNVNPLAYSKDVEAGFGTLDPAVAEKFYNSGFHALFPSALDALATGGTEISAVAFSGTGGIDDVVITKTVPNFIASGEGVVVPFTVDAGVAGISVQVGQADPIAVDMTAQSLSATLPSSTTAFTVTVTVDEANGYTLGGISYNGTPVVNGEVTDYAGGAITITTTRNNFNLFDADGEPIEGTFQTLTEAFAAEDVAMIKLAYDYDALAFEGEDFAGYDVDGEIVLDLNGNDLDGGDDSAGVSLFRVADTLTIIDSVGGGSITYDTQYGYAIVKTDGDTFIGAATGDAGATFNGKLFEDDYEGTIVKGSFDNANNADGGVFLWDGYVDDDSDYELVDGYWVVTPQNTPQPTTYEVTWTLTGGSASATSGDDFEAGDEIVFTADTGKTLSFVSIDGTEIVDTSVYGASSYTYTVGTADAELVVTFTESAPATYEVTWTLTGGTASATSGDDFDAGDEIVFTADSGKTLSFVSIDGTEIADTSVYGASSYTYTVGTADAELVVTFTAGSEENWPTGTDLDALAGQKVSDVYTGISADFDKVDAKTFVTWASGVGGVAYADKGTTTFNLDCFLLNIANNSSAEAIATATATAEEAIKITAITFDADGKPVITAAESYGNGVVVIEGTISLEDIDWHAKADGDHFFRAKLVVDEVEDPQP